MQPSLLVIALSLELIHARLLDRPQDLSKHEYDYIIVGGERFGDKFEANNLTVSLKVELLAAFLRIV